MGEFYSLHLLVVFQVGNKDEELWSVIETNKEGYEGVVDALNNENPSEVTGALNNMETLDTLSEYEPKEDALDVAHVYADANPVTIYVTVPLTY